MSATTADAGPLAVPPGPGPAPSARRLDPAARRRLARRRRACLRLDRLQHLRRGVEAGVPAAHGHRHRRHRRHPRQPRGGPAARCGRDRRGRMVSFTVNYLTLILVIVLLFQSLNLAVLPRRLRGSFNAAFLPFIGMAIAVAWLVLARRLRARADEPASAPASRLADATVDGHALDRHRRASSVFGLAWLWMLEPADLARRPRRGVREHPASTPPT